MYRDDRFCSRVSRCQWLMYVCCEPCCFGCAVAIESVRVPLALFSSIQVSLMRYTVKVDAAYANKTRKIPRALEEFIVDEWAKETTDCSREIPCVMWGQTLYVSFRFKYELAAWNVLMNSFTQFPKHARAWFSACAGRVHMEKEPTTQGICHMINLRMW